MATRNQKELSDRVFSLHGAKRLPVSEIAKRLSLDDDAVRVLIVERWRKDKESGGVGDYLRYE